METIQITYLLDGELFTDSQAHLKRIRQRRGDDAVTVLEERYCPTKKAAAVFAKTCRLKYDYLTLA